MATSIFELFGTIMVDNKDANKSISETDSKAGGLAKTFANGAKKIAGFGAAAAGVAAAGVTAITKLASSASESLDEVDKASQRMLLSTDSYQELAHVTNLCGVEMSTLERAAKNLDEGVTLDQALDEIYSLQTAEERASKAAELFGDSVAYQLTPMLNETSESMAGMRQEAHDLGLVVSEDAVKSGANLNDTLYKLKASLGGMVTQLGASLMPIVQKFADLLLQYMPRIQQIFDRLTPVLITLFDRLMPPLMDVVDAILPVILELLDTLMPIFTDLCDLLLPILVDMLNLIAPLLKLVSQLLSPILELVNLILKPVLEFVHWIFGGIVDGLTDVTDGLEGDGGLLGGLGSVAEFLFGGFSEAFGLLGDIIGGAVSIIGGAFEGIVSLLTNPKQALTDFFGWASGKLSGLIEGIKSIGQAISDQKEAKERLEKAEAAKEQKKEEGWHFVDMGGGTTAVMDNDKYIDYATNLINTSGSSTAKKILSKITGYAEGGVFEPNKPFLGVLGDQKKGLNVEAPVDTIKQAVAEVIGKLQVNCLFTIQNDMDRTYTVIRDRSWIENKRTNIQQFG